ncbi:MAG TPA: aldo/keto reductase [Geminicoccus sp.]|jgi:aryl-alcohol dehydrogenase-like predicted oxidoreductase|uniref:aldo/keto reductase n=1 Tax=Geminicoccus sp. TaxID=2024832 RepID=UPI002E304330|nr:aldo/keto reductase [Geminicoccus sp.]HEX2526323.1 aldo/keto reductase [Geminicoccus sp.]
MTVERYELAPGYRISRMLRGGWQLAGGHGPVDQMRAIDDMAAFVDQGITTFDCADIYTGVEEMIGVFRAQAGEERRRRLKVHTKFVPDLGHLHQVDRVYVERVIDRSLRRLRTDRLDLVQFHWWDYAVPGWQETAAWLVHLQKAGKIHLLGGTNFDRNHSAALIDAGMPLVSMQSQYSLLDSRVEKGLVSLCEGSGMKLLCYGTLAGGFLSEHWLGRSEPDGFENRSLIKYKLIIDDVGGWELFQALLQRLKAVADRHGVAIGNVATRWVLDRPQVAGVIVGSRYADHLADNLRTFSFELDQDDHRAIDEILAQRRTLEGDCFDLERDRDGRHGRIMKYDLSRAT